MKNNTEIWNHERVQKYQKICKIPTEDIYYGPSCPKESELNIFGNPSNKNILELGCGGAQHAIYLAKRGAKVTGIDISPSQIKYAKKLAKKKGTNIELIIGDIQDLKKIKTSSKDFVYSIFAFQFLENLDKCFNEVHRVLKGNRKFIFSLDHPAFHVINPKTMKAERSYLDKEFQADFFDGKKIKIYNHSFSEVINSLIKNNFSIEKILEPNSNNLDPWTKRKIYSKELIEKIPPSIIYISKKEK